MSPEQLPRELQSDEEAHGGVRHVAATIGDLVAPEGIADTEVLADDSRGVRWAGALFAACAVILVPWTIYLAVTLPHHIVAHDFDLAWVGFDVALVVVLLGVAVTAFRRSRHLAVAASFAAALLLVDAWFDVVMSRPGAARLEALAMAVVIEVPLAAVCLWLAFHAVDIAEERIRLLLRQRRG